MSDFFILHFDQTRQPSHGYFFLKSSIFGKLRPYEGDMTSRIHTEHVWTLHLPPPPPPHHQTPSTIKLGKLLTQDKNNTYILRNNSCFLIVIFRYVTVLRTQCMNAEKSKLS